MEIYSDVSDIIDAPVHIDNPNTIDDKIEYGHLYEIIYRVNGDLMNLLSGNVLSFLGDWRSIFGRVQREGNDIVIHDWNLNLRNMLYLQDYRIPINDIQFVRKIFVDYKKNYRYLLINGESISGVFDHIDVNGIMDIWSNPINGQSEWIRVPISRITKILPEDSYSNFIYAAAASGNKNIIIPDIMDMQEYMQPNTKGGFRKHKKVKSKTNKGKRIQISVKRRQQN